MASTLNKIGILTFAANNDNGVLNYTKSLIDALKNDSTNKYILFCNHNDDRYDNYDLEIRKLCKSNNYLIKRIIYLIQFIFLIRKPYMLTKDEINLFHDINFFISPAVSAYPHYFLNKPFVFTLHDMQEKYYPYYFTLYERFRRWISNKTLVKCAYKIICESDHVKNDIINFTKTRPEKIVIIQSPPPENLINFVFTDSQLIKIKSKYNLPKKYIFYPAHSWPHKNHLKLVEAFSKINDEYDDIYLILTGNINSNYKNILKRIDELGLAKKIRHLGCISYEELLYVYKMSIMLVMPTLFESVSIPIYESFFLKVPVCASNVVALPEQVGDAGILFDPNDVFDMAKKISILLKDETLRNEKMALGFEIVSNFNHKEYKDKLMAVLNQS
mgnify:FL=1